MQRFAALVWMPWGLLLSGGLLGGCSQERRVDPVLIANERLGPMTIAVAPALNQSGAADFDPNRFADLMASELSYADGISVIPVSRVLGVLAAQDLDDVESEAHAYELLRLLGADAILVFAVTEYDPYVPPSIAISAQLYGTRPVAGGSTLDPVALSKQADLASSVSSGSSRRIVARTQRVLDASHDAVVEEIKEFAGQRGGGESPFGWRRYVVSQQDFIRFCCHATIRALLSGRDETVLAGVTR
jgi:hypothetical protein